MSWSRGVTKYMKEAGELVEARELKWALKLAEAREQMAARG